MCLQQDTASYIRDTVMHPNNTGWPVVCDWQTQGRACDACWQGLGQLPDPMRGCQDKLDAFEALGAALRRGDPGMQADLPAHMDRLLAVLLEHLGACLLDIELGYENLN